MKNYMVIEHYNAGQLHAIYERFHAKGRMLPNGLHFIDSWLASDGSRCFQLMQTSDPTLFSQWEASWTDLMHLEVIELGERPEKVVEHSDMN